MTLLVTNACVAMLSLSEAMVLLRVRWQIELLFKLWKSHGQIDEWQSQKPYRILCEVYAKLIVVLIQHWLILMGTWQIASRSFQKAANTYREARNPSGYRIWFQSTRFSHICPFSTG